MKQLAIVVLIIFLVFASGCIIELKPKGEEVICCKITPVVLEPEPKYEWREKIGCPPSQDIVGANFEVVDDSFCENT
jgi:hypothetical protein